jgi:hypothetical protein
MTALEVRMNVRDELIEHLTEVIQATVTEFPGATPGDIAQAAAISITAEWTVMGRKVCGDRVVTIISTERVFTTEESATAAKVKLAVDWSIQHEGPPTEYTGHADLLEQQVWWKSADGPVKVVDMGTHHIRQVLSLLQGRCADLRMAYDMRYLINAPDEVQASSEDTSDSEWFEGQPLIQSMRAVLRGRSARGL